jgi:hypothetical protein
MRTKKIILPVILAAFLFAVAFPLQAQDNDAKIKGNFLFGYRMVGTDVAMSKYKEDFNLEDGFRLFNLNMQFTPGEKLQNLFNRFDLRIYNFGGDPFESFGLTIQKFGAYKFQYDRKKSTYFYEDMQTEAGHFYDLHTFDFERISDSGTLKVFLTKNFDFYLNFDKYTKEGESVTTYDINRIEFEFDKPIKEESNSLSVGFDFHGKRYSVLAEGKYLKYSNDNSLFLPEPTDGGAGASYPSYLNFFIINQPYDFKTDSYTVKVNANPFNSLLITGSAQFNNQELNLYFSEGAKGLDYLGNCFEYGYTGDAAFTRAFNLYDADLTWLLFDRLAIVGAFRATDFEQSGSMTIGGTTMDTDIAYDTTAVEGGLQYQFSNSFALTGGYRYEKRDLVGTETVEFMEDTTRNGFFGNLKANLFKGFSLTMDYQNGSYENPFSLIGPTGFNRFRTTAKFMSQGFSISAIYLMNKTESEVFGQTAWESDKNQINFRIGYHGDVIGISAGYSYIDVEHKGDRTIMYPPAWSGGPGSFEWDILYEGTSSLIDGSASFAMSDNLHAGAYLNLYNNKGFWEIKRTMFKGYIEYAFANGVVGQIGYRSVDFKEKLSGANDYKANIIEISFGYRWK